MNITEIFETATEVNPKWSNAEVIKFHAFNPNGLVAYLRDLQTEVLEAVENGKAKSGVLFVYGSIGGDLYVDNLYELTKMQRVNGVKFQVAIEGLERKIKETEIFLEGL